MNSNFAKDLLWNKSEKVTESPINCLRTGERKLNGGQYEKFDEFFADLMKFLFDYIQVNRPSSTNGINASETRAKFRNGMEKFKGVYFVDIDHNMEALKLEVQKLK